MSNEELIMLYREGDMKALDELVRKNQRIIYKLANKYNGVNRELEIDDLTQAGNVGLLRALERYNPNIKNRAQFITYAIHWINREICNTVNGRGTTETGNMGIYRNRVSLNVKVNHEDDIELIDTIESHTDDIKNVEEKLYIDKLHKELESAMNQSNTLKERQVLKFRYGWTMKPLTLQDIGKLLDISSARVRQLENRGLRHLRSSRWARTIGKNLYVNETKSYRYNYNMVENKIDFDNKYFKGTL